LTSFIKSSKLETVMKLPARLIAAILIIVSALLLIRTPVFAQAAGQTTAAPQAQVNLTPNTDSNVPQNLHTFSQSLMLEIMSSLACDLSGRDPLNPNGECLGYDTNTGKIGYVKNSGGAVALLGSMIAVLYTPPIHTSDFIAYLQQNFGLAKPTYAQVTGIGFEGLAPLLHAWTVFRDIVYLLFVFVFILIGLAIMLRVRIDPRTVMTIQNQIPKIIISLVLVTFSFAIAGFLIDLMWVSLYVIINLMSQADPNIIPASVAAGIYNPAPQFANDVLNNNTGSTSFTLGGIHNIAFNAAGAIANIVQKFISPDTLPPVVASSSATTGSSNGCFALGCIPIVNIVVNAAANVVGGVLGAIGNLVGGVISNIISWVVGILAYLILIIALLWALLRLWFALLKAYISILIDVIFAPFWIVGGLIPGQQAAGFGAWLRDMAGNLAAFPAAILMILLARLFSDAFVNASGVQGNQYAATAQISSTAFVPPLISQGLINNIAPLIALGVILATPGVVDMTKKAFKSTGISLGPVGKSVGAATGAISGAAMTTAGIAAAGMFNIQGEKDTKGATGRMLGRLVR
jgi:hypothetical protein